MRKLIFILIIVNSLTQSYSQNLENNSVNYEQQNGLKYSDLDKRNGFKDFTFGDSYNLYANKLIPLSGIIFLENNVNVYSYSSTSAYELFNVRWEKLKLGFTKGKLTHIGIDWDSEKEDFEHILNNLTQLFGKPELFTLGRVSKYSWIGKDINMELQGFEKDFSLRIYNLTLYGDLMYNFKKQF